MPRITMEMLRRRSEHNEGEISTLEELSLHQENIEKIEFLNQACRHVKILLLQYNLISKIENLHKLKKLEYLNLALNNIEVIENLEGLESLKKLDLTINFIGDLRDVKNLRHNEHLSQLMLTGNPFCEYEGYREYVIATLPQLVELDMKKIERSERIKALQKYAEAQGDVIRGFRGYSQQRQKQKLRRRAQGDDGVEVHKSENNDEQGVKITEINDDDGATNDDQKKDDHANGSGEDTDEEEKKFWKEKSYHTPEDRLAIAKKSMELQNKKDKKNNTDEKKKYVPKLFSPEGRPYNVNQAKVPFLFDDEDDRVVLEVVLYKHLDTSLVDVDVQAEYVRVTMRGKYLQLVLPSEVAIDKSYAQRNTTTGNLLITMPKLNASKPGTAAAPDTIPNLRPDSTARFKKLEESNSGRSKRNKGKTVESVRAEPEVSKREFLEIGPPEPQLDDLLMVVGRQNETKFKRKEEDFVDDPSVPPLEEIT